MPLNLTGIQNVGEFYSHHDLDALVEHHIVYFSIRGHLSWHSNEKAP